MTVLNQTNRNLFKVLQMKGYTRNKLKLHYFLQ